MFVITDFLQFIETALMISMTGFTTFLYYKTRDALVRRNLIVMAAITNLFVMLYIYDYFTTQYIHVAPPGAFDLEYTYAIFSMIVVASVSLIVSLLTRYGIELFPIKRYILRITYRSVLAFIVVVFVATIASFMVYFGNDLIGAIGAAINFYYPLASLGVFIIAFILIFQYRSIESGDRRREARFFLIAFLPQIAFSLFDVLLLRNYYLQLTHLSYTVFSVLAFYHMSTHVFINYEQEGPAGDMTELAERWGLTEREVEVAVLLVDGRMNRELAQELCISENTVKSHIKSIYRKCGASNRLQLIHLIKQLEASHPQG